VNPEALKSWVALGREVIGFLREGLSLLKEYKEHNEQGKDKSKASDTKGEGNPA